MCGSQTCLVCASMLIIPALFAKSKKTVHRIPLGCSIPCQYVAGGFWAVILSRAVWKRSWAGCDPTHSIILVDRSVAITGDLVRAQILTA